MRATGAYMAGFGTAGSLLACAAVLFMIGTGVVAFQGWPSLAGPTGPASVAVELPPAGLGRPATPRPANAVASFGPAPVLAHRVVPVLPVVPARRPSRRRAARTGILRFPGTGSAPIVGTGGSTGTGGATVINLHSTSDTGGVGASSDGDTAPKSGRVISRVTSTAGKTVGSAVGGTADSAVTGVTGATGSAITGAGKAVAGAVAGQVSAGASSLRPGH